MSIAWLAVALLLLGFAALPWWLEMQNLGSLDWTVWLFFALWTVLTVCPAMALIFAAFASIVFVVDDSGTIRVLKRLGLVKSERRFVAPKRVVWVQQNHYSKNSGDIPREVVLLEYVKFEKSRRYRLASDIECRDLPGLVDWFETVAMVKCVDRRRRTLID